MSLGFATATRCADGCASLIAAMWWERQDEASSSTPSIELWICATLNARQGTDGRADHTGRVCGLWQQAALGSAWEIAAMRGGARMERDGRSGTRSKSEKAKVGTGITGMGKGLSGKSSSGNRPKWEWPNAGIMWGAHGQQLPWGCATDCSSA